MTVETRDCTCVQGDWLDEDDELHGEFIPDFDCAACNWRSKLGDELVAKIKAKRGV